MQPLDRESIRAIGLSLGFARVGFAPVDALPHRGFVADWVGAGLCGELGYLREEPARRGLPTALLPAAQSAIVVLDYHGPRDAAAPAGPTGAAGRLARFARGADYHPVLAARLHELAARSGLQGAPLLVAVDTRPLLERELAAAAGLGFIGKNTLLVTPGLGSFTSIGVLLTGHQLAPDPRQRAGCGRCRRCLEACPTGALREPYLLDARRCIAALTVEQRGPLPPELGRRLDPWLFGCDRCQEVCPFNARPRQVPAPGPSLPSLEWLDLAMLLGLRSSGYRRLVRGRALRRASRLTLARNAALLAGRHLGPGGTLELRAALEAACDSPDPALRQAARLALGRQE